MKSKRKVRRLSYNIVFCMILNELSTIKNLLQTINITSIESRDILKCAKDELDDKGVQF